MWEHVLCSSMWGTSCQLCGESLSSEMQLQHCLVKCPKISDLRQGECQVTEEEIRHPEPLDFPRILAFVASVLERHRWLASDSQQESGDQAEADLNMQPKDQREKAEEEETKEKEGTAGTAEENEKDRISESQEIVAPAPISSSQSSESKTLHLVLQPQRSYDDSPLGRFKEKILQEVATNRVTIIVAPTGCGKSTRSLG